MSSSSSSTASFAILLLFMAAASVAEHTNSLEAIIIQRARAELSQASNRVRASIGLTHESSDDDGEARNAGEALDDCDALYEVAEVRLSMLLAGNHSDDDALTWLSGALAGHRTCLEGLEDKGFVNAHAAGGAHNLTVLLGEALALSRKKRSEGRRPRTPGPLKGDVRRPKINHAGGLLTSWDPSNSKADFVVAKDGSGTHGTINEAVHALTKVGRSRPERVVIYVKSGVYFENVEIGNDLKNVMFVGDGMDRTIVSGHKSVPDGSTTYSSATFGVSGDGFWARDMTFENTAGPAKHQAVALRVNSDLSVFYRCSMKAYQDTLFVHSLRQFYRDCHIYGTIDFIFGDASAIIQNCDIYIRKPMSHQSNMITAQGRDHLDENTGISVHASRVLPSPEFAAVKSSYDNYLGRPWKKYSRTVFLKTDLDGLIHPKGWTEWSGNFATSTLYYAEYQNSGAGAKTDRRVNWAGFHVLTNPRDTDPFSVSKFIQGESWIPATGVPFWAGI